MRTRLGVTTRETKSFLGDRKVVKGFTIGGPGGRSDLLPEKENKVLLPMTRGPRVGGFLQPAEPLHPENQVRALCLLVGLVFMKTTRKSLLLTFTLSEETGKRMNICPTFATRRHRTETADTSVPSHVLGARSHKLKAADGTPKFDCCLIDPCVSPLTSRDRVL